MSSDDKVKVVVRIRPQNRLKETSYNIVTGVVEEWNQVKIPIDKTYTFDKVFDIGSEQGEIFEFCALPLIHAAFKGYNATILAYGQTGAGKTFTMGTSYDVEKCPAEESLGVIPRSIKHFFMAIKSRIEEADADGLTVPQFEIAVSFMELYNEEVYDLLSPDKASTGDGRLRIVEDDKEGIVVRGMTRQLVADESETFKMLDEGTVRRAVASTEMNSESSRSHAIFTLYINQSREIVTTGDVGEGEDGRASPEKGMENLSAKFHFVDLAGSERLKRTKAEGNTAKEGISINSGLMYLGNVISALGTGAAFIPYRDSKLTRLLQDSLGGNSKTLMIACISPNDADLLESTSTLNYADRAKKIKNKVQVNQSGDKKLKALMAENAKLKSELARFKNGEITCDDAENENRQLNGKLKASEGVTTLLSDKNGRLMKEMYDLKRRKEQGDDITEAEEDEVDLFKVVQTTEAKMMEMSQIVDQLRKENDRLRTARGVLPNNVKASGNLDVETSEMIAKLRAELQEKETKLRESRGVSITTCEGEMSSSCSDMKNMEHDDGNTTADDEEMEEDEGEVDEMTASQELREQNVENMSAEYQDMLTDINMKRVLIDQLESTQINHQRMKDGFEKKIVSFQENIRKLEENLRNEKVKVDGKKGSANSDELRKMQLMLADKEKSIKDEKRQLKKFETELKRVHADKERASVELAKVQAAVTALKRDKVVLANKIQEENCARKRERLESQKKVVNYEKEKRKKDIEMTKLQREMEKKNAILKRKVEETVVLKQKNTLFEQKQKDARLQKASSNRVVAIKAAGRGGRLSAMFSPINVDMSWSKLQKLILKEISTAACTEGMTEKINSLLNERTELFKKVATINSLIVNAPTKLAKDHAKNELIKTNEKLAYVGDMIVDHNAQIMELEKLQMQTMDEFTTKTEGASNLKELAMAMVNKCKDIDEAKYLMQKLVEFSVNTGISEKKAVTELNEKQICLNETQNVADYNFDLINQADFDQDTFNGESANLFSRSSDSNQSGNMSVNDSIRKSRRKTAVSKDLLESFQVEGPDVNNILIDEEEKAKFRFELLSEDKLTDSQIYSMDVQGDRVLIGARDCTAVLHDIEKKRQVRVFKYHQNTVLTCAFAKNDTNTVITTSNETIYVWDVRDKEKVACLTSNGQISKVNIERRPREKSVPSNYVSAIYTSSFDSTGKYLFTGDGLQVRVWDTGIWQSVCSLRSMDTNRKSDKSIVRLCIVNEPEDELISVYGGSLNGDVSKFVFDSRRNCQTGNPIPFTPSFGDIISSVQCGSKDTIYVTSRDRSIGSYDKFDLTRTSVRAGAHDDEIRSCVLLNYCRNDQVLVTSDRKGILKSWDISNGRKIGNGSTLQRQNGGFSNLNAYNDILIGSTLNGNIEYYSITL
uniref:Kinesin motor domain-containing protein n=1 Tax=Rhabditophanes sp. KR3021 TaxID=114890 RepID=A0AC35UDL1_9BILA